MIKYKTHLYGLIGYPVRHSLSAFMHNAAFRALKINAEYRLFEVKPPDLRDFLLKDIKVEDIQGDVFSSRDIVGFNITIPHKVRAREILEVNLSFSNQSQDKSFIDITGAVNTVKRNEGCLNTDVYGFGKSLEEDLDFFPKDRNIFLIGCGGAGRAILAWFGFIKEIGRIYVYDISRETVDSLNRHVSSCSKEYKDWFLNNIEFVSQEQIPDKIRKCQLLINASFVGMKESDIPCIDRDMLHKNLSVFDVVYNRETRLIKDAKSLGLRTVGGLGMLLYQGVKAFEFWTGKPAPVKIMKEALDEAVKKIC